MSLADDPYSDLIQAYLSGTASEGQVNRLETLMRDDPAFRDLFETAEAELHEELKTLEPVSPPAGLFDDVVRQIDQNESPAATVTGGHNRSEPWRTISIISSLAAAIAIGFHIAPNQISTDIEPQIQAMAFLQGNAENGLVLAMYDPKTSQLLARFTNVEIADDQVQQLWLVRDGADAPISLGIIAPSADGKSFSINIEEQLRPGKDTLAISLEPPGGSQIDGPSGPVILAGIVEAI